MGDPRLRAFCEAMIDHAWAYASRVPMRRRTIRLGSRRVSIAIPDRPRADGIDPLDAFIDTEAVGGLADFELICFDARGPVALPTGTWPSAWHGPLGVIRPAESAPFRMSMDRHTQTMTIVHPGICKAAVWMYDFDLLPYWSAATPLRLALSWLADTFDAEFMHGALLARADEGLVLAGRSGAGKSTASFQARGEGFTLVSDDYFLVEDGRAHPVYCRAKLHDASIAALTEWSDLAILNPDAKGQKRVIDIALDVDRVPTTGVRLRAGAVPFRRGAIGFERVAAGTVFRHLAPYSLSGLLGGTRRSLLRIARSISGRPAWLWDIGEDRRADMESLHRLWEASDG